MAAKNTAKSAVPDTKTLTRADLATEVFRQIGLSRQESAGLVDGVFDEIITALAKDQMLKLPDFGTFILRRRGHRIGRNPKTGEEIPIAPRMSVSFRAAPKFKSTVDVGLKKVRGIPKKS